MYPSTAKLILDRLNEKCEICYCFLNEAEVLEIIISADNEAMEMGLQSL